MAGKNDIFITKYISCRYVSWWLILCGNLNAFFPQNYYFINVLRKLSDYKELHHMVDICAQYCVLVITCVSKWKGFAKKRLWATRTLHEAFAFAVWRDKMKSDTVFFVVHLEGILPKGLCPPCLRMADRALLAGYPRDVRMCEDILLFNNFIALVFS